MKRAMLKRLSHGEMIIGELHLTLKTNYIQMKNSTKFLIVMFSVLLLVACSKNTEECGSYKKNKRWKFEPTKPNSEQDGNYPIFRLDTTFLNSISFFPEASFWIYEKNNSGIYDTVRLVSRNVTRETTRNSPCNVIEYVNEKAEVVLTSSYYKATYTDDYEVQKDYITRTVRKVSVAGTPNGNQNFYELSYEDRFTLAQECCLDVNFGETNFAFQDSIHRSAYLARITTCIYGSDSVRCDVQPRETLYFIKNIGLVYRETADGNEIWNLIDYKIN